MWSLSNEGLSDHIVLTDAVCLRWNTKERKTTDPTCKSNWGCNVVFLEHVVGSGEHATSLQHKWSERFQRRIKWDPSTSLGTAGKRKRSFPKTDCKEFTVNQKGTKNWWLESLHKKKKTLTENKNWGPNKQLLQKTVLLICNYF